LDLELAYPIVWPQQITLYQVDDFVVQANPNDTYTFGFNTFLDALDGVSPIPFPQNQQLSPPPKFEFKVREEVHGSRYGGADRNERNDSLTAPSPPTTKLATTPPSTKPTRTPLPAAGRANSCVAPINPPMLFPYPMEARKAICQLRIRNGSVWSI